MTTLRVNGRRIDVAEPPTIAAIVQEVTQRPAGFAQGVAVAVNGEVVPRGGWAGTQLVDGDTVEIITAVQGG
ncbi:sulfur carrier protein ThiS [Cryptosporangium aurantiacum]|uniref:Sulfur carrier protein ThiS n=1 Tax=Cryptosporangium aurantiacum TaxID=134849 RepID=A0A1M7QFF1_9ACTN|nr:sulfur carrier protein ThiS [Cryptosporangium aurantiacum]SHN29307.1 sulfur carrier protein ThiS [Cryptosporangium aurantiacum]